MCDVWPRVLSTQKTAQTKMPHPSQSLPRRPSEIQSTPTPGPMPAVPSVPIQRTLDFRLPKAREIGATRRIVSIGATLLSPAADMRRLRWKTLNLWKWCLGN